jgi:hypothetical protein
MSEANASADRREQILGEVAEGLHAVFKETQRRMLEAEDNDDFVRLSGSLHKIGRGLRQSLALHARFEKERRDGAAEAARRLAQAPAPPAPPLDPQEQAVETRKAFITRGVERCVWSEYDEDDENEEATAYSLLQDLSDRLDELAEDDAFLSADVDVLIEQFCREVGVDPPERPVRAHLPDAPPTAHQANGHDAPDSS